MKQYEITLEISGRTALWTRPDGTLPVSYPAPTFQACKGIFESICYLHSVEVIPTACHVCAPLSYRKYATNYAGPSREKRDFDRGSPFQHIAVVLENVCYRLFARAQTRPRNRRNPRAVDYAENCAHFYKVRFDARVQRGQCFDIPFLGWREFLPDYFGKFRPATKRCVSVDETIPSLFHAFAWSGCGSRYDDMRPIYRYNVRIDKGELIYA
jgi:CRISPR-associated protein Cas5d